MRYKAKTQDRRDGVNTNKNCEMEGDLQCLWKLNDLTKTEAKFFWASKSYWARSILSNPCPAKKRNG